MKIINLRMYQLRRLKELELSRDILNTEALMLILNKKYKTTDGKRLLFKYLDAQEDQKIMARKLYTINMLNASSSYKNIEELNIPEYVVIVDGKITGFAMALIENHVNLGSFINDSHITFSDKKDYLIQLGNIIDKVERVKDESFRMQFADLNEYNFVIDQNRKLSAVDLDSAFLGQDEPSNMAYYLLKNSFIQQVPEKYKLTNSGIVIPNDNSDLYCYNMILLDTISNHKMFKEDLNTYYLYLDYLDYLGIDKELIEVFKRIYLPKENINPKDLISIIPDDLDEEMDFKTFQKKYKHRFDF